MIIVKLMGGLGNQMFQYALGKHLALKNNTTLKLDLNFLLDRTPRPNFTFRNYELEIFNITASFASEKEISNCIYMPKSANWKSLLKQKIFRYHYVMEQQFNFDEKIFNVSGNIYLEGYWQSEKYFIDIEEIIRKDFSYKTKPEGRNLEILNEISLKESVSIHLRGGDYINKEETNKAHFTCDNSYYERCLNYICGKIKNPYFFIFSDDPEWAKDFLKINKPCTFVTGNSWNRANYEDLRLMSHCKHNIIANSSFSWWAAWLNNHPHKIVLAPKQWVNANGPFAKGNINDFIPANWIRL